MSVPKAEKTHIDVAIAYRPSAVGGRLVVLYGEVGHVREDMASFGDRAFGGPYEGVLGGVLAKLGGVTEKDPKRLIGHLCTLHRAAPYWARVGTRTVSASPGWCARWPCSPVPPVGPPALPDRGGTQALGRKWGLLPGRR